MSPLWHLPWLQRGQPLPPTVTLFHILSPHTWTPAPSTKDLACPHSRTPKESYLSFTMTNMTFCRKRVARKLGSF